jgi:hypothetical protein
VNLFAAKVSFVFRQDDSDDQQLLLIDKKLKAKTHLPATRPVPALTL